MVSLKYIKDELLQCINLHRLLEIISHACSYKTNSFLSGQRTIPEGERFNSKSKDYAPVGLEHSLNIVNPTYGVVCCCLLLLM